MSQLQSYHFAWLTAHPEYSEQWLRDKLREGFHVHHIDFDHSNDLPDNLVLVFGIDHLANLHGWRQRPRKPRPAPVIQQAELAAPRAPRPPVIRRRAYANPSTFKPDPGAFIAWQAHMGFNNGEAATALSASPNSITRFRKHGAPAGKQLVMHALAAGITAATPWTECRMLGDLNRTIRGRDNT